MIYENFKECFSYNIIKNINKLFLLLDCDH